MKKQWDQSHCTTLQLIHSSFLTILELENTVVVLKDSWLAAQLRRYTIRGQNQRNSASNSKSSPRGPLNTILHKKPFWKWQRSNWLQVASSVLLPWLYFLHLCYHTGYVLPKARILSRHCTPIVNHEKTREELPQLTDLESSELDKELIHLGFYLTH